MTDIAPACASLSSIWRQRKAWAAFALFAAEAFAFASWVPRLPELKALLDLGEGALGILLLALPIGALLATPLTGWLSLRLDAAKLNAVCSTWMLGSIGSIGAVPPVAATAGPGAAAWALGVILLAVGMGSGAMGVAMNAAGAQVETHLARPVLSRCHAMFSFGMAGGGLASGAAIASGASLSLHLAITGAVLFCVFVWAVRNLPSSSDGGRGDAREGPRFAWPTGALLTPALVALGCLLAEGAALDWSPIFLATVLDADPRLVGLGVTAFGLAMGCIRLLGDRLSERTGDAALVSLSAWIAATGWAAVAVAPTAPVAFAGFMLVGVGLAPIVPVAFRLGARSSPGIPGLGIAAVSTLGYVGFLLGPAFIGLVAEATSLRISFAGIAVILLAVGFVARQLR